MGSAFDFILNVAARFASFLFIAIDGKKNLTQKKRKQFFVIRTAKLEFLNDLPIQLLIVRRGAGVKDVFCVGNIIVGKKIVYLGAGKMNLVYFCFIGGVVEVFLRVSRTIKYHVAFRDNLLVSVKRKMRFPLRYNGCSDKNNSL